MKPFDKKTVIVTGATSGIGKSCAYKFAGAGANLVICGRRADKLSEIGRDIERSFGVRVHPAVLDVRNRGGVNEWFASIPAELLPASVLVNNAGLALGFDSVSKGDPDDWDTMIDTNIKGLLYVSRAFLASLPENADAHIVNIGSIAGVQAYPNGAAYCGTKAAVKFISDAIRMEIVDRNIRVTNIQPGLVETEFSVVRFHGDADRAKKVYEGIKPLSGDDIADIVLFAASAPQHVQIAEITITATHQANAMVVSRKPKS